jgi:hypothetical protein
VRELTPNEPTERHDPHGHAKRAMQLDERNGLLVRRCEPIEKARTKIVATRNKVSQCRNRIPWSKTRSSGSPSVRSIRIPRSQAPAGSAGRRSNRARAYSRGRSSMRNTVSAPLRPLSDRALAGFPCFRRAGSSRGAEILQHVEGAGTDLWRHRCEPRRGKQRRLRVGQSLRQRIRMVPRLNS